MRPSKIWRSRVRHFMSSFILFGLGVTSCLMFLQISQNQPVFTTNNNYQEYQLTQLDQNQEFPCGTGTSESGSSTIANSDKNPYFRIPQDGHSDISSSSNSNTLVVNVGESNDYVPGAEDRNFESIDGHGPILWVITPTFYRPEQKPELIRLAQALLPVRNFIRWIIVEDIEQGSNDTFKELETFLSRFSQIKYMLLKSDPPNMKIVGKPRGVGGRRAAIAWLRKHYAQKKHGNQDVVYFADDDNTYDSDIFRQMVEAPIPKISMFPVGLVTDLGVSSPIVHNGKVVGFYDGWSGLRKFPVDMAGFALHIQLFIDKPGNMPWIAGYEEDELLKSLGIMMSDIKPLASNCTSVRVSKR